MLKLQRTPLVAAAFAATVGLTAPVFAQDNTQTPVQDLAPDEADSSNNGGIHLDWGVDLTTAYFFRGIVQEDQGIIVEPFANVTVDLADSDQGKLTTTVGIWNSFQDEHTGAGPGEGADLWYEADLLASIDLQINDAVKVGFIYTAYTSPNGAFDTVQEIGFRGAYTGSADITDDVAFDYEAGGGIYFETDNAADGFDEGVYAELGFTPGFTVDVMDQEVAVTVPFLVGLSVDDYYEQLDSTGGTNDETFGYASVGLAGELPLAFIPEKYGDYSATASVTGLWLGDTPQAINGGSGFELIGQVGVSGSY